MSTQHLIGDRPPDPVVASFLETADRLYVSEDLDETLLRLTTAAAATLPDCDFASITVVQDGRLDTRGETDPRARLIDEIQYETRQGPCWDAVNSSALVYTPDMARDDRWPRFCARAREQTGVASLLSCRLALAAAPDQTVGALNLYALEPGRFGEHDRDLALLYAAVAAIVLDASQRQLQLRQALDARDVIGQAMGVLMAQTNVTADQAFDQLRRASQRLNIKLRDLATRVAAGAGNRAAEGTYRVEESP
jgi:hypothetical protein